MSETSYSACEWTCMHGNCIHDSVQQSQTCVCFYCWIELWKTDENFIICEIDKLKFRAHAPLYTNSSDTAKLKTARMRRNMNRGACNSLRAESSHQCELKARISDELCMYNCYDCHLNKCNERNNCILLIRRPLQSSVVQYNSYYVFVYMRLIDWELLRTTTNANSN